MLNSGQISFLRSFKDTNLIFLFSKCYGHFDIKKIVFKIIKVLLNLATLFLSFQWTDFFNGIFTFQVMEFGLWYYEFLYYRLFSLIEVLFRVLSSYWWQIKYHTIDIWTENTIEHIFFGEWINGFDTFSCRIYRNLIWTSYIFVALFRNRVERSGVMQFIAME